MAEIITYSLRGDHSSSDAYYRAVASFTDEWLPKALDVTRHVIAGFRHHRLVIAQQDRSDTEYVFELLVLGVTLREHGGEAVRLLRLKAWALIQLIRAQSRWPIYESRIKQLRGWLGWLGRGWERRGSRSSDDIDRLLMWLRANGQAARTGARLRIGGSARAGPIHAQRRTLPGRDCSALSETL